MPPTITIACPECHKEMKAPITLAGKTIRCKDCGHSFVAGGGPAPARGKPAPAKGKGTPGKGAPKGPPGGKAARGKPADDEEDANPYGVTETDLAPR